MANNLRVCAVLCSQPSEMIMSRAFTQLLVPTPLDRYFTKI